jgi:hypothetical protein
VALTIRRYDAKLRGTWDDFVRQSKNGTFLFLRDYMDYHRDRFADYSMLILDGARLVAVFPANRSSDDVHSHQGLTYGGMITSSDMTTPLMLDVFDLAVGHLQRAGVRRLHYKTMPSIYHQLPADEDRYALFLANAVLERRDVLSVLVNGRPGPLQTRRRRGAAKAARRGVGIERSADWAGFWALLSQHLESRFAAAPVHSLAEIERLHGLFPENISLHLALLEGEILAGAVIYASRRVAHAQYIASSRRGRELGALDQLFLHLLQGYFAQKQFFDFGISNEQHGRALNRGLIEQKEGFGARAVVHDFYRLEL